MSSTAALEPAADESRGRVFPCEQCGAELTFSIGVQRLRCQFCSFEKQVSLEEGATVREQDLDEMLRRVEQRHTEQGPAISGAKEVRCQSCGGNVVFDGTVTLQRCGYCGGELLLKDVHDAKERVTVDGVLPFAVEHDVAAQNLRAWVSSRWFAPNRWKRAGVAARFAGVYVPYYTFDAMTATRYAGQRGDAYYVSTGTGKNRRTERRVRWSRAAGSFQRFFDDVLVPALQSLPHKLLVQLEPWPLQQCRPFSPELLAGKQSHTYDVPLPEAFVAGKQRITGALQTDIRRRIGGDEQRIDSMDVRYSALRYKHLLLPLWLLAYRYGDKSYRVVVNACTGEVQGERPYSAWKIALCVLSIVIACAVGFGIAEAVEAAEALEGR